MNPELTIRAAGEADVPAVMMLIAQPEMDAGAVLAPDAALAQFRKLATYPNYRIFVAERDGEVVGSYALLIMDNLGHMGAPSAIAEQVLVAPSEQGRGVGRRMMHHAYGEARAAGCYKLVLSSNMKRERAHAFYDGLGFTRHGFSFRLDIDPWDNKMEAANE